jgi:hypothetical protein
MRATSRAESLAASAPPHRLRGDGQTVGESLDPAELLDVAPGAPRLVVDVLTSPSGVCAERLQVPIGQRADPNVCPCRRDHERSDALQCVLVSDRSTPSVFVGEPPTPASPGDPGHLGAHPSEPRHRWRPRYPQVEPRKRCGVAPSDLNFLPNVCWARRPGSERSVVVTTRRRRPRAAPSTDEGERGWRQYLP